MTSHINKLDIKNFKCFKNLKVAKLARVNLITGRNNVGKTALLEAVELVLKFDNNRELGHILRKLIQRRQKYDRHDRYKYFELDILHKDNTDMQLSTNSKKVSIKYYDNLSEQQKKKYPFSKIEGPFLELGVNQKKNIIPVSYILTKEMYRRIFREEIDKDSEHIHFITSTVADEKDIAVLYGSLVDLSKERFLDNSLSEFDKNITALKQKATENGVILKLTLKDRDKPVLLSSLGEGVNRYVAILCAIWASKNGVLLIDEIENGLHHSLLDQLWTIMLKTSKDANCQIFATTHSKECLESYAQIAKKLADKDIALVELGISDGELKNTVFNTNEMINEILQGLEVRGWGV